MKKMECNPLPKQETIESLFRYSNGKLIRKVSVGPRAQAGTYAGRWVKGYRQITINRGRYYASRLIWKLHYGEDPIYIDHINGDTTDDRIENLRSVSHRENHRNQALRKNNTSGVCGVYFDKSESKWRARIKINYKYISLGQFVNFDEAVKCRREAEKKYRFHTNHGKARSKAA